MVIPLRYCRASADGLAALTVQTQAVVKRFHRGLLACNRSPHTQRMYVRAVVRWLEFGGQPGHVDRELVARFLATRRRSCAAATVNMDIKALRAFYLSQLSWGDVPAAHVQRLPRQRKPPARLPRALDDAQVGEILAACPDTFIGRRDRVMLMTLYATGIRAGELLRMHASHVIDGDLLFIQGKGGHDRYVPMGDMLARAIDGYLQDRRAVRSVKGGALWVRGNGAPLRGAGSVWAIVSKRIWQALGLRSGTGCIQRGGRPWTGHFPHEMRSSCATALLARGMPLPAVAELLGHADMATTALYTAMDLDHLRGAVAHHPRALRAEGTSGSAASPDMKALNAARLNCLDDSTPTAPRRRR